ncbi:MAG: hypothetical protein P1S60_02210, partial [Anaerolineae bacterium]|nr:hypothetical protein [Anaerolineae bacterium]
YGAGTDSTLISGNYIGVGSDGASALPNYSAGVWIESGPSSTTIGGSSPGAGNVISAHSASQIALTGSGTDNSVIAGNIIGLAADGLTDLPGASAGIYLDNGVNNVIIGGTTSTERNIISGNADGVVMAGTGTYGIRIIGNYIGTDSTGMVAVGNSFDGISIESGASDNEIGGDLSGEGNLISANGQYGIMLTGATTSGNVIQGNKIGTDVTGMSALPNGYDGIHLRNGTLNNTIGGATVGSANLISGNTMDGIEILIGGTNGTTVQGNWIGVDATGWGDLGNGDYGVIVSDGITDTMIGPDNRIAYNGLGGVYVYGIDAEEIVITENSIFQNAYDGIVITLNANNNILPPTITATSLSSVLIEGTACSGCTVEVFSNLEGEDQGRTFLGSATADGSGDWSLSVACFGSPYLTATATDAVDGTSEFSSVFTSSVRCLFMPLITR